MYVVKQLLLRIPDDLHARIAARASRAGRSANAIATEILEHGVSDESGDARAVLQARARRLGVLACSPAPSTVQHPDREAALVVMAGAGAVIDRVFEDGR